MAGALDPDAKKRPAPGSEQSPAFANGAVIDGKYAIEETIAEGGVGVVVRATHTGLGQRVAIKYLKPKALRDPALVERFEHEGRLAAQIASDHVVRVHDVGRVAGAGPYMVMEYLVGRDLGSILEEGALPIERAVDYLLQACDALAEAHALRIVHRDIKPDNLFLAQRPSNTAILKIIDFGVSKAPPKATPGGEATGSWKRQTGHRERFGTPLYMSPEQLASSSEVDQRTDIWALGVVLFELITGVPPFDGSNPYELRGSILTAKPRPLQELLPGSPEGLEAILSKCLEKDPANRFRNVAELAQELCPYGTTDARTRVARIRHVVKRGGFSIRPPTVDATKDSATTAGHRNDTTLALRGHLPRRIAVAALAGLVVVAGIVLLFARRSTPAEPPVVAASAASVAPVAPSAAPVAAPVAAPSPAPSAAPVAAAPVEPAAVAPPVADSPASATPARATVPRKAAPPPTAAPRSDRRTMFGERK